LRISELVGVEVERDRGPRVTGPPLDGDDVESGGDPVRNRCVPEIVHPESRSTVFVQAGSIGGLPESSVAHVPAVHGCARASTEDEVLRRGMPATEGLFSVLPEQREL
jgi:hypothetical protein